MGKANHIGFPRDSLSMENMTNLLKITLAIEVSYYVCITAIKVSILCMYLRFGRHRTNQPTQKHVCQLTYVSAVTRSLNVLCICTIVFHLLFFFISIGVTLFQCQPLHKMWDLTLTVEGVCINTTAFFYCKDWLVFRC